MAENFRVSGFVLGLAIKAPCHTHADSNITPLFGTGQTIGGYTLTAFDRILLTAQTDPIDNGIYSVRDSAWIRDGDADGNRDWVGGTLIPVWTSGDTDIILWRLEGDPDSKEVGADALIFSMYYNPAAGGGGFGTLQQVTDTGFTTDNEIEITGGADLEIRDGGSVIVRSVGNADNINIAVGAALGGDAVRFIASAGVDVYSFDEPLNTPNSLHIGATERLAFYQFDAAVTSYIRGAAAGNDLEYVAESASHVFTGELEIPSYRIPYIAFTLAANSVTVDVNQTSACEVDIDPATGDFNVVLTAPAQGAGFYYEINIDFVQGNPDFQPIWPASVKWPIGIAPILSPQEDDLDTVHLYTTDGGVTWKGSFLVDYS